MPSAEEVLLVSLWKDIDYKEMDVIVTASKIFSVMAALFVLTVGVVLTMQLTSSDETASPTTTQPSQAATITTLKPTTITALEPTTKNTSEQTTFLATTGETGSTTTQLITTPSTAKAITTETTKPDDTDEPKVLTVCPVDGTSSYTDWWGGPSQSGGTYKGITIFAYEGTPVVAPADGFAQNANNSLGGISFRVFADNGYYFYGANIDSLAGVLEKSVKNGEKYRVKAGDLLGYVGNTGYGSRAGSPLLYFEIHKPRRTPQNPIEPIRAACLQGKEIS